MPATFGLKSISWARNFSCTIWLINENFRSTIEGTHYLKEVDNFEALFDWFCAYVDCVIALVHLFFWVQLLVRFLGTSMDIASIDFAFFDFKSFEYTSVTQALFVSAAYRSFTLMFLKNWQFQIYWVSSDTEQWSDYICFVSFTFELLLKFDVLKKSLPLFVFLGSFFFWSPLKAKNPACKTSSWSSTYNNHFSLRSWGSLYVAKNSVRLIADLQIFCTPLAPSQS